MSVFCIVFCLLIGVMIFEKACLLDIMSIFAQIDQLTKCENSETLQLQYIKGAVVLHERVNR